MWLIWYGSWNEAGTANIVATASTEVAAERVVHALNHEPDVREGTYRAWYASDSNPTERRFGSKPPPEVIGQYGSVRIRKALPDDGIENTQLVVESSRRTADTWLLVGRMTREEAHDLYGAINRCNLHL